jgi:hypothetical protein
MTAFLNSTRLWLAVTITAHLIISMMHGAAHTGAHVPLSPLATAFVFVVILGGPLAGLALLWVAERFGAWTIAIAMAGSLLFGVMNHFVFDSPDHVAHIDSAWRPLFATTAGLLVVTEVLGLSLALRLAKKMEIAT